MGRIMYFYEINPVFGFYFFLTNEGKTGDPYSRWGGRKSSVSGQCITAAMCSAADRDKSNAKLFPAGVIGKGNSSRNST